jgi:uncharacterized damage-inducible protein DinB
MKKTTLLLTVLLLTVALTITRLPSYAATPPAKAQMVADWQRAKAFTKEYLDAMPEAGTGFKPTPEIRSFAEQMLHLANANFNFAAAATGATNPYQGKNLEKLDEFKTKAGLSKVVLESYDFVMAALNKATDAQMAENVKLFNHDLTRGLAFEKAFEHQTHHRGQATVYLRLKGVTPPGEKLF